jgi:hypothetical protein
LFAGGRRLVYRGGCSLAGDHGAFHRGQEVLSRVVAGEREPADRRALRGRSGSLAGAKE